MKKKVVSKKITRRKKKTIAVWGDNTVVHKEVPQMKIEVKENKKINWFFYQDIKHFFVTAKEIIVEFLSNDGGLGIILTFAKPGNGKTLDTTRTVLKLFDEYAFTRKKYPNLPKRELWSNMKFSEEIEREHLGKDLFYWRNPKIFWKEKDKNGEWRPKLKRDIDIIWDDVGIQCPNDGWKDFDNDMKDLFIMYRHRGIRMWLNLQDYKMLDIHIRRMVKHAYKVQKVFGSRDKSATLPPLKHVWGLIIKREFDPDEVEAQSKSIADTTKLETSFIPSAMFFITKRLIDAYDTTEEIPREFTGLGHREQWCINENCPAHGKNHPKGKPKISHFAEL